MNRLLYDLNQTFGFQLYFDFFQKKKTFFFFFLFFLKECFELDMLLTIVNMVILDIDMVIMCIHKHLQHYMKEILVNIAILRHDMCYIYYF